ncbi:ubiquitin-conjugating enzyme E2 U-like [Mytilus trossulus]|uniref:ubiquitin-conjugating enzyme E2 U-like n=1 Tax=Mytilus trossulus TaxID=6551 RepID=UPI003004563A
MFSRAHLLIEREYEKLQQSPPWGIEALPLQNDSLFEWVAKIKGLKDSLWEGGIFRVYIKFDEHYNVRPPDVCFHTIPFHPNVDMITGRPCIDFLDDYSKWQESYSLSFILITIQNLLSNPNLDSPVNPEASDMIIHSPHAYRQMVLDCVVASQRVEAGITPHSELESRVRFATPTETTKVTTAAYKPSSSKITRLSFDDYHTTWSGIATSKPAQELKNPLLEMIKESTVLQKVHLGLPQEEIEEQMKRQIEEHSALMYGNFKTRPNEEDEKAAKLARLSRMKKIYLPPRLSPTPSTAPPPTGHRDEPWENEVEDLVTWSSKLDTAALDE